MELGNLWRLPNSKITMIIYLYLVDAKKRATNYVSRKPIGLIQIKYSVFITANATICEGFFLIKWHHAMAPCDHFYKGP